MRANHGMSDGVDPFVFLLSESTARAVVTVAPGRLAELELRAAAHGVPVTRIGAVARAGDDLAVHDAWGESLAWTLAELHATADATLPALFG